MEPGWTTGVAAYEAVRAAAEQNLRLGCTVIVDAVNDSEPARDTWRRAGAATGTTPHFFVLELADSVVAGETARCVAGECAQGGTARSGAGEQAAADGCGWEQGDDRAGGQAEPTADPCAGAQGLLVLLDDLTPTTGAAFQQNSLAECLSFRL